MIFVIEQVNCVTMVLKTKEKKKLTVEVLVTLVVNSSQLFDEKEMNERNQGIYFSDKLVYYYEALVSISFVYLYIPNLYLKYPVSIN